MGSWIVNGILRCDHNKRLITLTSDYIKRLSLLFIFIGLTLQKKIAPHAISVFFAIPLFSSSLLKKFSDSCKGASRERERKKVILSGFSLQNNIGKKLKSIFNFIITL